MKRILKITLISLGSLLVILLVAGFAIWYRFNSNLMSFEKGYEESLVIEQVTVDGYTFWDRNKNGTLEAYEDDRKSTDERVRNLLSLMTIEEKIHILKGSGIRSAVGNNEEGEGIPGAVGTIVPTPRLGIPTVYLSDGPAGLRIEPTRKGEDRTYYCTAFPIATVLASTWNQELVYEVGNAMGTEALEYGIDVILGPGANIHRHPLCARNFEYYSEDPVLSGNIGAAMINGIESKGIGTSLKHFVANNQETDRFINNSIISERALREIYLKGFEITVKKSQPWTIMSAYNKVNGTYLSENEYLLTDVLRDEWGFEGLVMTDWFAGRNASAQISAGNDLLEPGTKKQWDALLDAYEEGELTESDIDRAAGRILKLVLQTRKMKNLEYGNNPDLEAHAKITRQSASEGMILLKNEGGVLPLEDKMNVALLGVTSYDFIAGGTGSGDVNEAYVISLEQGLDNAGFEINATAKSIFDDHKALNEESFVRPVGMDALFNPYDPPEMAYSDDELADIVSSSDIGIYTIGRNAGEGSDRIVKDDFLLSTTELNMLDKVTKAFHAAGKKLIVVLNIGGVIETASWKHLPDGILLAWQGGQEGGNSVADILSGKENPSGRLPMTFPVKLEDHASNANFPLLDGDYSVAKAIFQLIFPPEEKEEEDKIKNRDYTRYDEGIYVGYRHFDKQNLEVSFPFGYGLSYTTFEYQKSEVIVESDTISIQIEVQNTGEIYGKEVIQVYTEKDSTSIDRPIRELRGFAKTRLLSPQESQSLTIDIPLTDLRYWDENKNSWQLEEGNYQIQVGASSRSISFTKGVTLALEEVD